MDIGKYEFPHDQGKNLIEAVWTLVLPSAARDIGALSLDQFQHLVYAHRGLSQLAKNEFYLLSVVLMFAASACLIVNAA